MNRNEVKRKYLELKKENKTIKIEKLFPLFDKVFDVVPEDFEDLPYDLFFEISTKRFFIKCPTCKKNKVISYKNSGRDIWNKIINDIDSVCVDCNRQRITAEYSQKVKKAFEKDEDGKYKYKDEEKLRQTHNKSINKINSETKRLLEIYYSNDVDNPEYGKSVKTINRLKIGNKKIIELWNIYRSNDINNKDWYKAKNYCENQFCIINLILKNRAHYWEIYKNNEVSNKDYLVAKEYCEKQIQIMKKCNDKASYFWQIYLNNETYNKDFTIAKEYCEKQTKNLNKNIYVRDSKGYITHINDIPIQEFYDNIQHSKIKFNESDFFVIQTGRTQDSTKRNSLLDDYLVKNNIGWFVYIKFDELGNPLVVGKSGSKLVNCSGCDVSFDKNPDGGPARQYLIDKDLDWDKTQIFIYRCETEQEALSKEIEIGVKYNLFFS